MISLKGLPLRNLREYAGRTVALAAFSALMAAAVFGGSMVLFGVEQGLSRVQNRLGADIVVTPAEKASDFDAQTVLVQAQPSSFYMDASKLDEVAAVPGVAAASPQLFLASAKASCCSVRVQLIAFDPATDFALQPWIGDAVGAVELGVGDVVVGSNVTVYDDRIIRFFNQECTIVGQFDPTGSTLDSAVYMTTDTMKQLIAASFDVGMNVYEGFDPDAVVSSVLVKVAPGADIDAVAAAIGQQVEGVSVATSTNMVAGIAAGLEGVAMTVRAFAAAFWTVGMLMCVLVFAMAIHARRREFATLRAMGAPARAVRGVVVREAVLVNAVGGVVGVGLAAVVLYMFSGLIGSTVGAGFVMPGAATAAGVALAALASVMAAAAVSAAVGAHQIATMDASLVLKEGE